MKQKILSDWVWKEGIQKAASRFKVFILKRCFFYSGRPTQWLRKIVFQNYIKGFFKRPSTLGRLHDEEYFVPKIERGRLVYQAWVKESLLPLALSGSPSDHGPCKISSWNFFRNNALFFLILLLCGCSKQALYTGLQEKEANDMVAILMVHAIECDKVSGLEGTWNIVVEKNKFSQAVTLLNEVGYPKDSFASMGEMFKKSGLVSSPLEERVRFMHALSENLAETLTHIHGVVTARVHIVLPDNDPYSEKMLPSSASVFISYLPQINIEECVRDIKQLVTNSIEGLSYDKVSVALFPAASPKERLPITALQDSKEFQDIFSIKIAKESVPKFWFFLGITCFLFVLCLGVLCFFFLRQKNAN